MKMLHLYYSLVRNFSFLPCSLIIETPWNSNPTLASTMSLLYLGVIATGLAWLIDLEY